MKHAPGMMSGLGGVQRQSHQLPTALQYPQFEVVDEFAIVTGVTLAYTAP